MNKRLFGALLCSVGLSSAVLFYWFGLGVGANRFGDVAAYNTMMKVLVPIFFGLAALTSWLVHSLVEEWLTGHSKGEVKSAARAIDRLPAGLRIIGELAFGMLAPVAVMLFPIVIAAIFT